MSTRPGRPHAPVRSASSHRPRLHFTSASGWINDPLGLTHHAGEYHLFFQHVPGATRWATEQHWGHATSPDLVRWTEHEPVLSPGDGDDGVWSGSLVAPSDGRPAVIFYTSVTGPHTHVGCVRAARPTDPSWTSDVPRNHPHARDRSGADLASVYRPSVARTSSWT